MQHELNVMREHLDEEYEAKQEVEHQLSKAFSDIQLGGTGSSRLEMIEREDTIEDNTFPMNPIEEKDVEISNLKQALETSTKACADITVVKSNLTKAKTELRTAMRSASVKRNKMDFARKVVEQRMDLCLSDGTLRGGNEEELVSLYSTLIDEDSFDLLEDDNCSPKIAFLCEVEKQMADRVEKPGEHEYFDNLKAKILEAVKTRKIYRRSRMDSIGRRDSVGSNSSIKRGQRDQNGSDSSRAKIETQ